MRNREPWVILSGEKEDEVVFSRAENGEQKKTEAQEEGKRGWRQKGRLGGQGLSFALSPRSLRLKPFSSC